MNIGELIPDIALSELLDNKAEVKLSATQIRKVRCYSDGRQPTKGLGEEFLDITWNGGAKSGIEGLGLWEGALLLCVYVKLLPDGTVNTPRVRQLLTQSEMLVHFKSHKGYFFNLNPSQVVMRTTPDPSSGYSATMVNVEWRTTNV